MVELLKGLRFETLRGVGTVLGWIQGTFNAFILKSLVFESFEHETTCSQYWYFFIAL